jgi:hypothetical protein
MSAREGPLVTTIKGPLSFSPKSSFGSSRPAHDHTLLPSTLARRRPRLLLRRLRSQGQALAYVDYDHPQAGDLTWDEARRIAAKKLPELLSRPRTWGR